MSDEVHCVAFIYGSNSWNAHRCTRRMKVMRNGKPYCAQHDPEKVKAKRDALQAKWEAEEDARTQMRASAQALADALGAGSPDGDTGGIVLSAEEAQRLIARLERMR